MIRKGKFIIVGLLAILIRLFINYRYELIPGINGGYYPVQIRSILKNGALGFPDFPLYFYISAFASKLLSILTALDVNQIILNVSKTSDAVILPLSLIPLYYIIKHFNKNKMSQVQELLFVLFAVISFAPFVLVSDLQKNAFAIPLFFSFLLFVFYYLQDKWRKDFIFASFFYLLIGLSHFGVFAVATITLLIFLFIDLQKRSIVLGFILISIFLAFALIFDYNRVIRLAHVGSTVFENPVIISDRIHPPDILNYLFSYTIIGIGFYYTFIEKSILTDGNKTILRSLIITLFIFTLPIYDIEYANRLNLITFVIQLVSVIVLYKALKRPLKGILNFFIVIMIISPFIFQVHRSKIPCITYQAFNDLNNLKEHIIYPKDTIVIARHGLEWWSGWVLGTYIGQDKAIDADLFDKYKNVIILQQQSGINYFGSGGAHHFFHEPKPPPQNEIIYSTGNFRAFLWVN